MDYMNDSEISSTIRVIRGLAFVFLAYPYGETSSLNWFGMVTTETRVSVVTIPVYIENVFVNSGQ